MSSYNLLKNTNGGEQLIYDSDKKELTLMSYSNNSSMKFEIESKDFKSIIEYKNKFNNVPEKDSDRVLFTNDGKIVMQLKSNNINFYDNKSSINITSDLDLDVLQQIIDELIIKE